MGKNKAFGREILVMGLLSVLERPEDEQALNAALEQRFGSIRTHTRQELFQWTDYYNSEMGQPIWRSYIEFETLVDPSTLADIKRATNDIEERFALEGRRRVNLDPGLLAPGRFVLATTKDRAHRLALKDGIYAELTLIYEKKFFHALPWTYPDWASEPVRLLLAGWRGRIFNTQP
ncbi:MAG: DUF4416 family protein [Spirochaetia bacterium]|jgi:hypothetical protein|nr:DUF4416 family protein [Spirochaetia bacterium]